MRGFTEDADGTWIEKGPGETLDYWINWPLDIVGTSESITNHAWTVPSGITKVTQVDAAKKSTVVLSGGSLGSNYEISCTITTDSVPARVATQTFTVRVRTQ